MWYCASTRRGLGQILKELSSTQRRIHEKAISSFLGRANSDRKRRNSKRQVLVLLEVARMRTILKWTAGFLFKNVNVSALKPQKHTDLTVTIKPVLLCNNGVSGGCLNRLVIRNLPVLLWQKTMKNSWNATKETKKLMAGDIGPATGCSSNAVYLFEGTPSWVRKLHDKFTPMLRRDKYKGPFDLNMIVTKDAMYALEATPRFGLEGIQNFIELWHTSAGETFEELAAGTLGSFDVDTASLAAAVRLAVGPYPFGSKEHRTSGDIPVLIDEADTWTLWMSGVWKEDDMYCVAPTDGCIGALVVKDTTIDRAAKTLMETAKRIHIPDLMYRNDVCAGHLKMWQELDGYGFDIPPAVEAMLKRKPVLDQGSPFKKMVWV